MKHIIAVIALVLCFAASVSAEDSMKTVFNQIDDLITRVESGISLNSFAETYAEMKIAYKKAQSDPNKVNNLLLSDRMKDVMERLDDYARAWKMQEVDGYKAVPVRQETLKKYSFNNCRTHSTKDLDFYNISCMKSVVLGELKPIIEKAKTAHYDGW